MAWTAPKTWESFKKLTAALLNVHLRDNLIYLKAAIDDIIAQEDWIAPNLLNNWVNHGGGFSPAGYMKDSLGFVHLRGLIRLGTIGQIAFTLPAGYRPAYSLVFVVTSNSAFGDVRVVTDGGVNPTVGSNVWFSLEGIIFKAEG